MKPLCIDLFAGLGGWTEGFLAEGWDVIGFDIERHVYGEHRYPAQLVLQDVCTIHGSQFKDADCIVASSPCQEFSYRAMPWKRAKALGPPELGMLLFAQARRIQLEAIEAAGRYIPMIQENVRGAQPWVGRAQWHYGSYYLWGDVPALMPITHRAQKFNPDGTSHGVGSWFAIADSKNRGASEGVKVPGMDWSKHGTPEYKAVALNDPRHHRQISAAWRDKHYDETEKAQHGHDDGHKGVGIGSASWSQGKGQRHPDDPRNTWSGSTARKAASARIAKIPGPLARHIAQTFKP